MRVILITVLVLILAVIGVAYYLYPTLYSIKPDTSETPALSDLMNPNLRGENSGTESSDSRASIPVETIVAQGLDTPWAIAFLPDGNMLVTERKGAVRLVDKSGNLQSEPVVTINTVKEIGEGGLLGMTLHPKFPENGWVYLYYTYESQGDNTKNQVVRMKYTNGQLTDEQIILDNIPGASNHNGGRIKFGPDNYLYITTGDAQDPSKAQDGNSLAGKILRVDSEGKAPEDNPYNRRAGYVPRPIPPVYSLGHRNPQGIAWDKDGNLWETEHGPSGGSLGTGNDEINLINSGSNYGWPEIQGDQTKEGMITPLKNSTPQLSWAPGDLAVIGDTLYFGGLRGQALYRAKIDNGRVRAVEELLKGRYGRIREVMSGPDGMLYITTSNRDGRGKPNSNDDKIIRINPSKL